MVGNSAPEDISRLTMSSMPIHKYWDFATPGTCLPVFNTLIIMGAINTTLDFLVFLLVRPIKSRLTARTDLRLQPVPLLWQLRTSIRQKCVLTIIFTMAGLYDHLLLTIPSR